ncbi:MAG: NnrS family protein [Pelomonas sp.]|nr:NnrS family protein [Roseateles sp.]
MASLLNIEEPPRPAPKGFALFALGFRPFYLLASIFAALSIPLWALQFGGHLAHPYLTGPVWHAHEMLFGFTLAVIVGFLFTAGRNWTNLPTPAGGPLVALAALWIAARVLVLTPYAWAAAAANVAFPLAAAAALAVPFFKARNKRNYFFVGLLILMACAAGFVHLSQLGIVPMPAWPALQAALDVVLFILVVMGGRVIPMFTNNGVPGTNATKQPVVEKAALGSVIAVLVADVLGLTGVPLAILAWLAAVAHARRLSLWRPWKTVRVPLVWVLHAAYAWVPMHLLLRGLAELGLVVPSLATHALTVGAAGGLIIGMMTRTARGHTGRPLLADRYETACYLLVLMAALVRVGVPLLMPALTVAAVLGSAALWSAAFGLYAIRYWPVLSRPRIDGRPG